MPHFYFFHHDRKFVQSITRPDKNSDDNAKYSTVQTESPNWFQVWKSDTSKYFRLFWKQQHCSGNNSEIQKIVGCRHFNNFNSTAKMTWQVILVLLENGEGEKGANKIYITFQNCKFKT